MYNSCGMVAIIGQLIHGYIMCMRVCDESIRDCTRVSKQIYVCSPPCSYRMVTHATQWRHHNATT